MCSVPMCCSPRGLSAALRYWSITSTQGSSVVSNPREEMEESSRARLEGMGGLRVITSSYLYFVSSLLQLNIVS